MEKGTILVVDDEKQMVRMLMLNLRAHGYTPLAAYEGTSALRLAREKQIDAILLDVMMPGMDGKDVCRLLKEEPATRTIPVLMISAKSQLNDRIAGLSYGADDYITKPFDIQELLLRIEAAIRQVRLLKGNNVGILRLGSLTLDRKNYRAKGEKAELDLTLTEFRILELLMRHPGEVLPREAIAETIFNRDIEEIGRSLDVHIRHLRSKFQDAQITDCFITTLRGVGYILEHKQ
ncbi:MAG: response regulator transcription factor [Spirochaetia bacterium]|jgi:two-component system alkaline phosphatase synthesis response regulator PhoP|nr:response regulator transcription factor [Spirochaetia bacterium]